MSRHFEHGEGDPAFGCISIMVDPFSGHVAMVCPASVMSFENLDEYIEWVTSLQDAIPQLKSSLMATPVVEQNTEPIIDKEYASTVIDTWQEQIMESLEETPKTTGRKKSVKKQKSSMNEDPNS